MNQDSATVTSASATRTQFLGDAVSVLGERQLPADGPQARGRGDHDDDDALARPLRQAIEAKPHFGQVS